VEFYAEFGRFSSRSRFEIFLRNTPEKRAKRIKKDDINTSAQNAHKHARNTRSNFQIQTVTILLFNAL
jgi:hypothetical protein